MICTYKVWKTEATFKGNSGYYSLLRLKWLLHVLNIIGSDIWKPYFKETHGPTNYKSCNLVYKLPKKWKPQIDGLFLNVLHI